MNILVIGSGGREDALAWKLSQSPSVDKLYIAPGNGGTGAYGENVNIKVDDISELVAFARKHDIDLVVPGPELPLTMGIGNAFADAGIPCFGPSEYCAQLEGSKAFAKEVMLETGVPTAHFAVFRDHDKAVEFVKQTGAPIVVKADGLAAGKGVIVCESEQRALLALDQIMTHKQFGTSGDKVVIEEMLVGEEVSFLAFCDGRNFKLMPSSQDHKAVGEGDTGPNTGGMGAFSPARILPEKDYEEVARKVIKPIVDHMRVKGHPFVGVLYAGLMITEDGPKVLEYNTRFGDPECQPLLMRLDSDLAEIMMACAKGDVESVDVNWKSETALCVVMAAEGYPESYPKGMVITDIDKADAIENVKVFQAGTVLENGNVVSSGGRVLGVTALGANLAQAQEKAYAATRTVQFEKSYYRNDIGEKGKKWEK